MKPRISSSPSRNALGPDARQRLRLLLVTGVVAQALLLVIVIFSTLRDHAWLLILAGTVGELGIVWLITRAWTGLEKQLAVQDSEIKIAQALASSLELDAVARMVAAQMYKAVPVRCVLLYRWHGERAALGMLARTPLIESSVLPAQEEAIKQTVPGRHPTRLTFSGTEGSGCWWVVPLYAQNRPVGVMALRERDDHELTVSERQLIERITRLAAVALHNAATFSQTDANLRERVVELSTIEVVSRQISATLDANVIASDVLAATMSAIEAEIGSCFLQTHNGEYDLIARIDAQGKQAPSAADWQRGVIGQVLRTRLPVLIADARLDSKTPTLTAGMRAQLCVPIGREGRALGVLHLEDSRANAFLETHLRLVSTLAEHAAIALENARLYDAVRTGRDQLQAILDSTRDAMLLFDSRGRLLQFNPVAQELIGRPLAPYLGRSFLRWLHETGADHLETLTGFTLPKLRQYIRDLTHEPPRVTHRQFEHIRGENVIHISETGSPVLDQQGRPVGWLLVWRDNTEERKLDMLRQEFSSMVVHDLRNPITSVISGMAMLRDLLRETPLDHAALLEVIQIAQDSSENMLNLVQSLLDIARLEQSKVVMDCESLDLMDSIDQAARSVYGLAHSAEISITTDVPDDLPPVWMDDEKIQRVLVNLLDNALRHTPHGGQIGIEAIHQPKDKMVIVRVVDTGPGIPLEARNRIFDKFVQLDSQRVLRGHKGTGLGLTFCKLVIEAHDGQIWVDDNTEGGAAFCFTLPMAHIHGLLLAEPD